MNFKRVTAVIMEEVRRITTEAAVTLATCATGDDEAAARLREIAEGDHPATAATASMALDILAAAGAEPGFDPDAVTPDPEGD
jgi:hypothetical protein